MTKCNFHPCEVIGSEIVGHGDIFMWVNIYDMKQELCGSLSYIMYLYIQAETEAVICEFRIKFIYKKIQCIKNHLLKHLL